MILRDLVSRISFRTDTAPLANLDRTLVGVKKGIMAITSTALSAWTIKAGNNILLLRSQFNAMTEDSGPLQKKIEELQQPLAGKDSIFSEEVLKKAGIRLKQLGFESAEAAELLGFSSQLIVRSGGDLLGTVESLGAGITQGGAIEALLKLDLVSLEAARGLRVLEGEMGQDKTGLAAVKFRGAILDVIRKSSPKIKEEFLGFIEDASGESGASLLGVQAQFSDVWNNIASTITRTLVPVMGVLAHFIGNLNTHVENFRKAWVDSGSAADAFFETIKLAFPEQGQNIEAAKTTWEGFSTWFAGVWEADLAKGAFIGGMLMFLLTKKLHWIGVAAGGATLLSRITGEWEGVQDFLNRPLDGGVLVGGTLGGLLGFFLGGGVGMVFGAGAGAEAGARGTDAIKDIQKEFEGLTEEQKQQRVQDMRSGRINPMVEFIQRFFGLSSEPKGPPSPLEEGPPTLPRPSPRKGFPLRQEGPTPKEPDATIHWSGDININGAQDPQLVSQAIRREFNLMTSRAALDLVVATENA